jgi:hypothetical protein
VLDNRGGVSNLPVGAEAARAELIAQTGVDDPSNVRLAVKENRKLSPDEVVELVRQYEAGATIQSLGVSFGLHTQTVRAHLRRKGVTLRSMRALTDEQEVEVMRLYVEECGRWMSWGQSFGWTRRRFDARWCDGACRGDRRDGDDG